MGTDSTIRPKSRRREWGIREALLGVLLFAVSTTMVSAQHQGVPPYFSAGYPATSQPTGTSFELDVSLQMVSADITGTVWWLCTPDGTPPPTAAQVIAGSAVVGGSPPWQYTTAGGANVTIVNAGSIPVTAPGGVGVMASTVVTGLSPQTAYDFYFIAADASGNIQLTPTKVTDITVDTNPPSFLPGFPYADRVWASSLDLVMQTDQSSQMFFLIFRADVVAAQAISPLLSDLQPAGQLSGPLLTNAVGCSGPNGVAIPAAPYFASLGSFFTRFSIKSNTTTPTSGVPLPACVAAANATTPVCSLCPAFMPDTAYVAYFSGVDPVLNWGAVTSLQFTTAKITGPLWNPWMYVQVPVEPHSAPTGNNVFSNPNMLANGFVLTAQTTGVPDGNGDTAFGTAFFMTVPSGSPAPTAAVIQAGKNYIHYYSGPPNNGTWIYVARNGSWPVGPNANSSLLVTGLANGTTYDTYIVAQDFGNLNTSTVRYLSNKPVLQATPLLVGSTYAQPSGLQPQMVLTSKVFFGVTDIGMTISVSVNLANTVYYFALVPRWNLKLVNPTPSGLLIEQGLVVNSTVCHTAGTAVLTAFDSYNTTLDATMTCGGLLAQAPYLLPSATYDLFVVVSDANGTLSNVQTVPVTMADSILPVCSLGTPTVVYNGLAEFPSSHTGIVTVQVALAMSKPSLPFQFPSQTFTAYWLAAPASDRAPSSAEVVAGRPASYPLRYTNGTLLNPSSFNNPLNNTYPWAYLNGSIVVPAANKTVVFTVQGLPNITGVNIWVVGVDNAATNTPNYDYYLYPPANNVQASPAVAYVVTADVTPPNYNSGYPLVLYDGVHLQGNQVDVSVAMSENCTVFYTVVTAGFTYHSQLTDGSARQAPTPAELMAFTGPGGSQDPSVSGQVVSGFIFVPMANTPVNVTITGLRNATRYWLWLVAEDFKQGIWSNNSYNVQTAATLRPFTTRVNTPPLYSSGYPFLVSGTDSIDVTINLFNISGYAKYIVVNRGATWPDPVTGNPLPPTTQDVLLGTFPGNTGGGIQILAVCGSWDPVLQTSSFVFNNTDSVCTVTGLAPLDWDVYLVAWDYLDISLIDGRAWPNVNLQPTPTKLLATTTSPVPPTFGLDTATCATVLSLGCPSIGAALQTPVVLTMTGATPNIMTFGVVLNGLSPGVGGRVYWVVLLANATAPNADSVRAPGGTGAIDSGTTSVPINPAAGVSVLTTTTMLTQGVSYILYCVAADAQPYPATMVNSAVASFAFTMPGTVAPAFIGRFTQRGTVDYVIGDGYQSATQTGGAGFSVIVELSKIGSYYFVVLPYGTPAPSAQDVVTLGGNAASCDPVNNPTNPVACAVACGFQVAPTVGANATSQVYNGQTVANCANASLLASSGSSWQYNGMYSTMPCCLTPHIVSQTAYDIWIVAQDAGQGGLPSVAVTGNILAPNVQLVPTRVLQGGRPPLAPSVITADITPPWFTRTALASPAESIYSVPIWYNPFPSAPGAYPAVPNTIAGPFAPNPGPYPPLISNITINAFAISVSLSEPGVVFYVVVDGTFGGGLGAIACPYPGAAYVAGATPQAANGLAYCPTQAQILLGQDANGNQAPASGNISCPLNGTLYTTNVMGLPKYTLFGDRFRVYYFAQDLEPTKQSTLTAPAVPNQSPVFEVDASTMDGHAPNFVMTATPGVYYPTVQTVDRPTGRGTDPITGGASISQLLISAMLDENGTCYYVAFPEALTGSGLPGSYPPTSAQVRALTDYANRPAFVKGTWAVAGLYDTVAPTPVSTTLTTDVLTDSVVYDVYVVCVDNARNYTVGPSGSQYDSGRNSIVHLQASPAKVSTTTMEGAAPLWTGNPLRAGQWTTGTQSSDLSPFGWYYGHSRFPYWTAITATSVTMAVSMTRNGSVAWVVVPDTVISDPQKIDVFTIASNFVAGTGTTSYTSVSAPPGGVGQGVTVTVAAAGIFPIPVANQTYSITIPLPAAIPPLGLLPTSDYVVYMVTVGPSTIGNLGDGDIPQGFVQNANKVAPGVYGVSALTSSTPATGPATVDDNDITLTLYTTSMANVTYVVLNAGSPAPTPWQIVNGMDSMNNTAPCYNDPPFSAPRPAPGQPGNQFRGGRVSIRKLCYFANTYNALVAGSFQCPGGRGTPCVGPTVTNLTAGHSYDIYMVTLFPTNPPFGVDGTISGPDYINPHGTSAPIAYNEFSRVPILTTINTTDTHPPRPWPGYPFTAAVNATSFTLVAQMNEPCILYYVVVSQVEGGLPIPVRPSAAQVVAGTDGLGGVPLRRGYLLMPSIFNNDTATQLSSYNVTLGGLMPLTVYDTYVAAVDLFGNLQALSFRLITETLDNNPLLGALAAGPTAIVTPPFLPSLTYFDAFVSDGNTSFTLTAAPQSVNATLTVNGVMLTPAVSATYPLNYGNNTFKLVVMAQDNQTSRFYQISVNRVPAFNDYNATLQALSIVWTDPSGMVVVVNSTNMGGSLWPDCLQGCLPTQQLNPDTTWAGMNTPLDCTSAKPSCLMDSNQTLYYVSIPSSVTTALIFARTTSPLTNVTIFATDSSPADRPHTLSSFHGGKPLNVNASVSLYALQSQGGNQIKILVRAPNGASVLYIVTVTRYGPGIYEGWQPVVPTTAMLGPRYGQQYAGDDPLTVRVLLDPTIADLDQIPKLDVTPPSFVTTYPQATGARGAVNFKMMLNKPGVCYFIILANVTGPYMAPKPSDVKYAHYPSGTIAGVGGQLPDVYGQYSAQYNPISSYWLTQETTLLVPGLNLGTTYTAWIACEDKAKDLTLQPKPNMQAAATPLTFVTTN